MKSAFYLTCADGAKDIRFTVQTNAFPYDVAAVYRAETTKQGTYQSYNVLTCEGLSFNSTSSISDVEIPTITYVKDLVYGGGTLIKDNASYAKDSRCDCKDDNVKPPYFVACVNGDGNTIPSNNVGYDTNKLSGDVSGYFGFHIIDKRFKSDYVAWAYINNIPYYKPKDTKYIGQSIKMAGLLSGYLYNGIPSELPTEESRNTEFNTQVFGSETLVIESIDYNEDAIPTRRLFYDNKTLPYINYKVDNTITNTFQYAQVRNTTLTLEIEDTSCNINKDIEGNLRITLLSTSVNDIKNGNKYLNVGNNLSKDETEITYYIFSASNTEYPLNSIVYDETANGYVANLKSDMDAWKKATPLTMFNYATTEAKIKEYVGEIETYSNVENDNGDTEQVKSNGFGTSGYFSGLGTDAYYIIGVTDGNVRTISPSVCIPCFKRNCYIRYLHIKG